MITYSTNFMGPISIQWYVERGLTKKVKRVHRSNIIAESKGARVGDEYEVDEVTEYYAGGRIDIRDDSKEGYDGWDEYSVKIMHGEDWNALSDWLDGLTTDTLWGYNELIEQFESQYGKKIRWAE
jgi:hypothetical protein